MRIDFRGDEIEVADEAHDSARAHDLELSGRLGDISTLIAAPLAGGLPTHESRGRRAIACLPEMPGMPAPAGKDAGPKEGVGLGTPV